MEMNSKKPLKVPACAFMILLEIRMNLNENNYEYVLEIELRFIN